MRLKEALSTDVDVAPGHLLRAGACRRGLDVMLESGCALSWLAACARDPYCLKVSARSRLQCFAKLTWHSCVPG